MKIKVVVFFTLSVILSLHAQKKDSFKDFEGEIITEPLTSVTLDTVVLLGKAKFQSYYDRKYYYWYRKKTYNAYPYAIIAAEKMNYLNDTLAKITSKRKRKRFTKKFQEYLEGEFTDELVKLTRTEGKIFMKLVYRQTGKTVNTHIKEKRSKWTAFWYRTKASLFKIKLDATYDPENDMKDYMVEDILQRAFQVGDLEEQKPKINLDFIRVPKKTIHIELEK